VRHHTIVCRLGAQDTVRVAPARADSHVTGISFIEGTRRLGFGLEQMLEQLGELGMQPSERAVDLALFAAAVTAADTRISRETESQDGWTREVDLHVPVADPSVWALHSGLITVMLNFLTGDRWGVHFRARPASLSKLTERPEKLRTADPSCVCLLSGGLDSFIGAIDLVARNEHPFFVSHYWVGSANKHQVHCFEALKARFPAARMHHLRAYVGFPNDVIDGSGVENTLRARSFLFFALAALAASAAGGNVLIHVPENGFISLNVPLDPLRLGALSTRTTHPYYMARFNELLSVLGITAQLENRYRHKTKGQMVSECADRELLKRDAKNTMSCASDAKARWFGKEPMHCGHCVPCLIRRAALVRGFGKDDTNYHLSGLRAGIIDTNKAEGEHVEIQGLQAG